MLSIFLLIFFLFKKLSDESIGIARENFTYFYFFKKISFFFEKDVWKAVDMRWVKNLPVFAWWVFTLTNSLQTYKYKSINSNWFALVDTPKTFSLNKEWSDVRHSLSKLNISWWMERRNKWRTCEARKCKKEIYIIKIKMYFYAISKITTRVIQWNLFSNWITASRRDVRERESIPISC